jgi:hypothetical protein
LDGREARFRSPCASPSATERSARLRAEIGALDTISTPLVAELRTRVAANCYHPSEREIAARLLAELTAELFG